jgi:ribonuclease P protein component
LTAPGTSAPTVQHPHSFHARFKLTRAADFEAVFSAGQRSADQLFTVLYRCSELDCGRLGMTVSAKRVPSAVARNRIRRLIRESFRQAELQLTGFDIVVLVKEPAAAAANAAIFTSLKGHWTRLRRSAPRA